LFSDIPDLGYNIVTSELGNLPKIVGVCVDIVSRFIKNGMPLLEIRTEFVPMCRQTVIKKSASLRLWYERSSKDSPGSALSILLDQLQVLIDASGDHVYAGYDIGIPYIFKHGDSLHEAYTNCQLLLIFQFKRRSRRLTSRSGAIKASTAVSSPLSAL
jgi:hypothetical protein